MISCVVMWKTDRSNATLKSTPGPGLDFNIGNRNESDTLIIESDTIK